jgi:hypothetical protein
MPGSLRNAVSSTPPSRTISTRGPERRGGARSCGASWGYLSSHYTLGLGTWVTCPTTRIHPAIVAQVSAMVATMMPGRFFLGVGTGENLNEHIVGQGWPETEVRHARLEEAIEVIRLLSKGQNANARLYTLPPALPPLKRLTSGARAALCAHGWPGNVRELANVMEEQGAALPGGGSHPGRW